MSSSKGLLNLAIVLFKFPWRAICLAGYLYRGRRRHDMKQAQSIMVTKHIWQQAVEQNEEMISCLHSAIIQVRECYMLSTPDEAKCAHR